MVSIDEITRKIENFWKQYWTILGIIFLLFGFYYVNYRLFVLYQISNPGLYDIQLWGFFQSKGFELAVIGFSLPIFTLFFNTIFKVREKVGEELEKRKEEKKQVQLDCINQTQEMWRDLNKLGSEIKYYEIGKNYNKANNKENIEEILLKIDKFKINAEEVFNAWAINFNRLSSYNSNFSKFLITPTNILLDATMSVAQFIYENPYDMDNIKKYQSALSKINLNVNDIFHHVILYIFKNYMIIEYENNSNVDNAIIDIKRYLEYMEMWSNILKRIEYQNNKFLPFLKDESEVCNICEDIEECMREGKSVREKTVRLKNLYQNLNLDKCNYSIKIPYTLNCMNKMANELDITRIYNDLKKRADWPSYIKYPGKKFSLDYPPFWYKGDDYTPSFWRSDDKFSILLYLFDGYNLECFVKAIKTDDSYNSLQDEIYSTYTGLYGGKVILNKRINQNGIIGDKLVFKCNKHSNLDIKLPYYVDITLLKNNKNVYKLEINASQKYYEDNKSIIHRTRDSFKLN